MKGVSQLTLRHRALEGKVAVVTGAGRGIGKAVAIAYAKEGAAVCCAARSMDEILETERMIKELGGQALAVRTDVTHAVDVENLYRQAVERFGGLDILVINAGGNYDPRTVEESNPEDWRTTLEVNLFGAYHCAQKAIPYLKQRGSGKIITIGSGLGHHGKKGGSAYSCSKAGLWMLTRILSQELWQFNISVNELIPGPVRTSMDSNVTNQHGTIFDIDSEWAKAPEDVTPLAVFLATQPEIGPTAQSFSLMRRDNG